MPAPAKAFWKRPVSTVPEVATSPIARTRFIRGDAHDPVIHSLHLVLGQFGLELRHDGIHLGRIMIHVQIRLLLAQLLARIKLDDFAAGLSAFLDRLKRGEAVEGVCLAADGESPGLERVGNRGFRNGDRDRKQSDGGETQNTNDVGAR